MAPPNMKLTYLTLCPGVTKQVWIRNSDQDVILQGKVDHFRNGVAGRTWSCAFDKMWEDPDNRSRISHPVRTTVIIKTAAYIITGEYEGTLTAVKYVHSYGNKVDMNDDQTILKIIQNHPEQLKQEFVFRAPPKVKRSLKPPVKKTNVGVRKAFSPRGATARAVKAGLISLQEAEAFAQKQQDAYEFKRTMSAIHEAQRKK